MNDTRRHPFEDSQLVMTLLPQVISAVVVHVSWMTRDNFPQFRSSTCIIQPKFTSSRLGLVKFWWTELSLNIDVVYGVVVLGNIGVDWRTFALGETLLHWNKLPLLHDAMPSRPLSLDSGCQMLDNRTSSSSPNTVTSFLTSPRLSIVRRRYKGLTSCRVNRHAYRSVPSQDVADGFNYSYAPYVGQQVVVATVNVSDETLSSSDYTRSLPVSSASQPMTP